jgi:tetratricopeptide (TPR) repeat protein
VRRLPPILLLAALLAAPALAGDAPAEPGAPLDPRVEKTLFIANHLYVRGSWFSALVRYQEVVEKGVTDPEIYYRAGYCARQLHRNDEMKEWFGKATPILEARVAEGGSLGDHYLLAALGNALLPNDPAVKELAGKAIEKMDAGAFGPLRKLSGPDLFRLSRLHTLAGDAEEAGKTMELARKRYRRNPPDATDPYASSAFQEGAYERMAAGDYAGALPFFEELVEVRPTAPGGYWNLGLARLRTGDLLGARDAWRLAKSNDVGYSTDAAYAAELADRIGRWARAHPDETIDVEGPYAESSRTEMEQLIADRTTRVAGLYANRAANAPAEPAPAVEEEPPPPPEKKRSRRKKRKEAQAAASPPPPPVDPEVEEIARAEMELAQILLAYLVRGYPVREVAMQYRLMGFIFQKTAD